MSGVIQYPDESPNPITAITMSSGARLTMSSGINGMMGVSSSYDPVCPSGSDQFAAYAISCCTLLYCIFHLMVMLHTP